MPLKTKLLEEHLQLACSQILQLDGWRYLKMEPVSRREWGKGFGEKGMADGLYIRYGHHAHYMQGTPPDACAEVMWIEWKRQGKKLKAHQWAWVLAERARGALVLACGVDFPATFEGFTEWYRNSGLDRHAL